MRRMFGAAVVCLFGGMASCKGNIDDEGVPFAVTFRVSRGSAGQEPNLNSSAPAISGDGQFVAFVTAADNLVPGDTNTVSDVFVRDAVLGTTLRASIPPAGGEFVLPSQAPAISADGRYVAFENGNLGGMYIYRRDLVMGVTELVSESGAGGLPNSNSFDPSISANGQFIAYESWADDLIAGASDDLSWKDIFVRDMSVPATAGGNRRASIQISGPPPEDEPVGSSFYASISADGRYVAFSSVATLTPVITPYIAVYVRDMQDSTAAATVIISESQLFPGFAPDDDCLIPAISADGNWVAFETYATDIIPTDTNGASDIYVRARTGGPTIRASVHSSGAQALTFGSGSFNCWLSGDGRYVTFDSDAYNLVSNDANQARDIFIRDVQGGSTIRASVRTFGEEMLPFGNSFTPAFSSDGRFVAFASQASNTVDDDNNAADDVFVRGPLK